MEIKDLLKIDKLSKKDQVMSVIIVIGLIILFFIFLGNMKTAEKNTVKTDGKVADRITVPTVMIPEKNTENPPVAFLDMKKVLVGAGREDPFLQPKRTVGRQGGYSSGFRLEGVTMDSGGRLMAIINDELIGVGGVLEGGEVISIEKDEVIIKKGEEEYKLKLWSDQDLQ